MSENEEQEEQFLSPGEEIAALKQHLLEAGKAFDQACAELNSERAVTDALVDRLKLSEARRIALQVAHGDLAPDTFESRRRASDATVDQIVSIVRQSSPKSTPS